MSWKISADEKRKTGENMIYCLQGISSCALIFLPSRQTLFTHFSFFITAKKT
jgi:hypothetical protein